MAGMMNKVSNLIDKVTPDTKAQKAEKAALAEDRAGGGGLQNTAGYNSTGYDNASGLNQNAGVPGSPYNDPNLAGSPYNDSIAGLTGTGTGTGHHGHHHKHKHGAEMSTSGAYDNTSGAAIGTGLGAGNLAQEAGNVAAPVPVGEKVFTVNEDHAVEKERVETWVEHRPVEREYVTTVEATGVTREQGAYADGAVAKERVIGETTSYPMGSTTVQGVQGNATGLGDRTL